MLGFAADFFSRPVGVSFSTALMFGWFVCLADSFAGYLLSGFFFMLSLPGAMLRLRWFVMFGDDLPGAAGTTLDFEVTRADGNPFLGEIGTRAGRLLLSAWVVFLTMFGVADAFVRAIGRP